MSIDLVHQNENKSKKPTKKCSMKKLKFPCILVVKRSLHQKRAPFDLLTIISTLLEPIALPSLNISQEQLTMH